MKSDTLAMIYVQYAGLPTKITRNLRIINYYLKCCIDANICVFKSLCFEIESVLRAYYSSINISER